MYNRSLLTIIGMLIAIPLSYFIQDDIIKSFVSFGEYISNLGDIITEQGAMLKISLSVFILGLVGYISGNIIEKRNIKKKNI